MWRTSTLWYPPCQTQRGHLHQGFFILQVCTPTKSTNPRCVNFFTPVLNARRFIVLKLIANKAFATPSQGFCLLTFTIITTNYERIFFQQFLQRIKKVKSFNCCQGSLVLNIPVDPNSICSPLLYKFKNSNKREHDSRNSFILI